MARSKFLYQRRKDYQQDRYSVRFEKDRGFVFTYEWDRDSPRMNKMRDGEKEWDLQEFYANAHGGAVHKFEEMLDRMFEEPGQSS